MLFLVPDVKVQQFLNYFEINWGNFYMDIIMTI